MGTPYCYIGHMGGTTAEEIRVLKMIKVVFSNDIHIFTSEKDTLKKEEWDFFFFGASVKNNGTHYPDEIQYLALWHDTYAGKWTVIGWMNDAPNDLRIFSIEDFITKNQIGKVNKIFFSQSFQINF